MTTFTVENPEPRHPRADRRARPREHGRGRPGGPGGARDALPAWAEMPGRKRARIMHRIVDSLEQRRPKLAHLESSDNGRPLQETSAQQEIVGSARLN